MKNASPVVVICGTIVLVVAIIAVALLLASGSSDASVGILTGFVGMLVLNLLSLVRTEQTKGTVDDLANGKMDAKIRAAVAEVVADRFIDPAIQPQLEEDRARRGEHA